MTKIKICRTDPYKMKCGIHVAAVEKIHKKLWTDKRFRFKKNNIPKFA